MNTNYYTKYLKYKNKYLKVKKQIGGEFKEVTVDYNGKEITFYVPSSFTCSLTLNLMVDPVMTSDNHIYDRSSIERWLLKNNTSPLTNDPLDNKHLTPVLAFKNAIKETIEEEYKKQLEKEIGELERLSNAGDCNAQFELALKYYYSNEDTLVFKNFNKALKLLKESSCNCKSAKEFIESSNYKESIFQEGKRLYNEKKYSDAANMWNEATILKHLDSYAFLSDMLIDGRKGVPLDAKRACQLALEGTNLGNIHSKGVLGHCYVQGLGVDENQEYMKIGFELAKESADAHSCFGQFALGLCYEQEWGVQQETATAIHLYHLAAIQGHASAHCNLAYIFYKDNEYEEAFKWFSLAAEQGLSSAQSYLGNMYENGLYVTRDATEAFKWYHLAAEQGYEEDQVTLGRMFENGLGVAKNNQEAVRWYRLAAEQGNEYAQYMLGIMFELGEGIPHDYVQAMHFYRLAAAQSNTNALNNLGRMFENGLGVPQDYAEAVRFYRIAAEKRDSNAEFNMGRMYELGLGVPQDTVEANRWYAAAKNHTWA
jgi:TPR repeat protein